MKFLKALEELKSVRETEKQANREMPEKFDEHEEKYSDSDDDPTEM